MMREGHLCGLPVKKGLLSKTLTTSTRFFGKWRSGQAPPPYYLYSNPLINSVIMKFPILLIYQIIFHLFQS